MMNQTSLPKSHGSGKKEWHSYEKPNRRGRLLVTEKPTTAKHLTSILSTIGTLHAATKRHWLVKINRIH